LFALSGIVRAILATLLARRVREFRKPRKEMSAQTLVMRVTGVTAMMGLLYDFVGRSLQAEQEEREELRRAKAGGKPPPSDA
jgi:hypothetical protein